MKINSEKNRIIGTIYRPPNKSIESFIEHMNYISSTLRSEHKDADFLGDYNINLLNSDSHPQTSEFLETMYSNLYIPLIKDYMSQGFSVR